MTRFQAGSATHATLRTTLLLLENTHDKPLKETIPVSSHHFRLDHRAVLREKLDLHGGKFALLCDPYLLAFPSPLGQPLPVPTVACLDWCDDVVIYDDGGDDDDIDDDSGDDDDGDGDNSFTA